MSRYSYNPGTAHGERACSRARAERPCACCVWEAALVSVYFSVFSNISLALQSIVFSCLSVLMHGAASYGSWFSPTMCNARCTWVESRSDHVYTTKELYQSSSVSGLVVLICIRVRLLYLHQTKWTVLMRNPHQSPFDWLKQLWCENALRDRGRSFDGCWELGVEPQFLHLTRMPSGNLPWFSMHAQWGGDTGVEPDLAGGVISISPGLGRPRNAQKEQESVAGEKDIWNTLLSLLSPWSNVGYAADNGWMEGTHARTHAHTHTRTHARTLLSGALTLQFGMVTYI